MQLVLSKNRVIAHGENFLAMGGVVINTETGAKYENATVAECEGCPSDIDKVGYEYHGGIFTPCAPYGVGNNNGFFMEVCESCATPRSSGIPIKQGLKAENMHPDFRPSQVGGIDAFLLWENASQNSSFDAQTISLKRDDYISLVVVFREGQGIMLDNNTGVSLTVYQIKTTTNNIDPHRTLSVTKGGIEFTNGRYTSSGNGSTYNDNGILIPKTIYGVKL